ncbi:ribosome-associated translation inhibitor RaiA [bacterium]|jgi:putative sigma-54 modulation protein|nr:ribosome-associated translation inhibitor RaiA [bacterium]MDB2392555.1 ribosome-associated translation inhibitor RaiA [Acidimicrobiaceae bacterium]MDB4110066.1 ribosome-associated translation inhibitor RaiA [bacterium]MDC3300273.1 ribosome-associated translation inhibitor RaiA [Acidimicrobiales bacterium]
MDVRLSAKRTELTPRLEQYTTEKVERLDRFVEGLDHSDVHFVEEVNPRIANRVMCEITVEGHGHHVRAKHTAPDPFAAVDGTVDKLERQLRKLKTRLIRRWHASGDKQILVDAGIPEMDTEAEAPAPPRIVKSKKFHIASMTAEEAVLELELVNHDFYFFHNSETMRAAIVYRREDGDFGLIDEAG